MSGRADGHAHDGGPRPLRRRAPERRHRAARDRLRARSRSPSPQTATPEPQFMGKTVLKSNLTGRTFRRNLSPVRRRHAPEPVRRPGPAGDPDGRPRPRHVLARPRRRDGRRAGRLRLDRQPLRRQPPLRARARARHRRPGGHAHRDPPLRRLGPDEDGLQGQRVGPGLHPQQLRALRVQRRPARRLDRGPAVADRRPGRAVLEPRHASCARTATSSTRSARSAGWARASGSTACASWASAATSSRSARSTRCTRSTSRTRPRRRSSAS